MFVTLHSTWHHTWEVTEWRALYASIWSSVEYQPDFNADFAIILLCTGSWRVLRATWSRFYQFHGLCLDAGSFNDKQTGRLFKRRETIALLYLRPITNPTFYWVCMFLCHAQRLQQSKATRWKLCKNNGDTPILKVLHSVFLILFAFPRGKLRTTGVRVAVGESILHSQQNEAVLKHRTLPAPPNSLHESETDPFCCCTKWRLP